MNAELGIVLACLGAAVVMFAVNRPRMDVVAILALVALPLTGIVTMGETLAGFADPNVVLIAALFVVGDGLVRTGVARKLGDWLIATAGSSEVRLTALLMVVVCGLGAIMSSTAVTAIFIPVALRISQSSGVAPGRLMMPLSFAALISGMMTLVATAPNLVVNAELVRNGIEGFGFFSFTPFGVPVLIAGILYMLYARRFLGPGKEPASDGKDDRTRLKDWVAEYDLSRRERRFRVGAGSGLIGKALKELDDALGQDAAVIAVERAPSSRLSTPAPSVPLRQGDVVYLDADSEDFDFETVKSRYGLSSLPLAGANVADRFQEIGMAEAILPANSSLLGKTIRESRFRGRYGLTAIGLRRGRNPSASGVVDEPLQVGDSLLLAGPWKAIRALGSSSRNLALLDLPAESEDVLPAPGKALFAVICLAIVIVLMVTGLVPNVQAALIGCLLMGATGCIDIASAYRSIDWKTIVLIVGMLPFSLALQRTGGDELAAEALTTVTGSMGDYGTLGCLFIVTAALGLFISNTATAVLMAPVAIAVSTELEASPYPFVVIVALAASTAFMTPVSSPVNTLVVGPGNYKFVDFLKVGVPFAFIVLLICVPLVAWLLPLK